MAELTGKVFRDGPTGKLADYAKVTRAHVNTLQSNVNMAFVRVYKTVGCSGSIWGKSLWTRS